MKDETRYAYQKRIRELTQEVGALMEYRSVARNIFIEACNSATGGKNMDAGWVARQFERIFK